MAKIRAAVYCRVSSAKQAEDGDSLAVQKSVCEQYCADKGYDLVGTFIDAAKSGTLPYRRRPALRSLMGRVEHGDVDLIVVLKLDRLFRSLRGFYEALRILEDHHVRWECVKEHGFDSSTAAGEAMLNMMLTFAQFEARNGSERVRIMQEGLVREGRLITGSVPFGLSIAEVDGVKTYVANPVENAILVDALQYYIECQSNRATRFYIRQKYGIEWTWQKFDAMITNDLYLGAYRSNPEFCAPTVDAELIRAAREVRIRCKGTTWHAKHVYIFTSVIKCPLCGCNLNGITDRKKSGEYVYYYRCPKHTHRDACSYKYHIPEKAIEPVVVRAYIDYLRGEELRITAEEAPTHTVDVDAQKNAIRRKIRRLQDVYLDDAMEKDDYERRYATYMADLARLDGMADSVPTQSIMPTTITAYSFAAWYDGLSREDRRSFWRGAITRIVPSEDGSGIDSIEI